MALYLSKFSYTPETWARLIANPEDRRKAAQSYIESVGGKRADPSHAQAERHLDRGQPLSRMVTRGTACSSGGGGI